MSPQQYRLYAFTANHYLSPLQCGLQTAHVVSELSQYKRNTSQFAVFNDWALYDKTIIICGAGNHAGVVSCFDALADLEGALGLPFAIFREDEQSMNGMATACGVIVPQKYWDVSFVKGDLHSRNAVGQTDFWESTKDSGLNHVFPTTSKQGEFVSLIKSFRLA